MGASLPYVNSTGALHKLTEKLRKKFPDTVTVDTLKKLGLAPKNETYLINTLRFLDFIDDAGSKNAAKTKHFRGSNEQFQKGMSEALVAAYTDLFETHGEDAWGLGKSELTTYFRMSDDTSEIIGQRQASTFLALAAEGGHGEVPEAKAKSAGKPKATRTTSKKTETKKATPKQKTADNAEELFQRSLGEMNFSLRIEMNLPTTDDKSVYDALFQSIRENLIEPNQSK
jgi:hypothetical protein